jgi:hypothetical protein
MCVRLCVRWVCVRVCVCVCVCVRLVWSLKRRHALAITYLTLLLLCCSFLRCVCACVCVSLKKGPSMHLFVSRGVLR